MTDTSNEAQAPEEIDKELILNKIKKGLLDDLNKIYTGLLEYIDKNLNINPAVKSHALMNLDQGVMWLSTGINGLQFKEEPSSEGKQD